MAAHAKTRAVPQHSAHWLILGQLLLLGVQSRSAVKDEQISSLQVHSGPTMTAQGLADWLAERQPAGNRQSDLQLRNAEYASKAKELSSHTGEVSEDMFLRDVLPFRQLDEPIDDWRPAFYEKLAPLVQGKMSLRDMAEAVIPVVFNGGLGKKVVFKPNNTPQVMAPESQTLAKGYASCTGLSILLADALRSVGVPARVVGIAVWNIKPGGNHNWVEVWWGGNWHFVDAGPVQKVDWDSTWFTDVAKKAQPGTIHGIYTAVVDQAEADSRYTLTWREPPVEQPALDRTAFYTGFQKRDTIRNEEDPTWNVYRDGSLRNR